VYFTLRMKCTGAKTLYKSAPAAQRDDAMGHQIEVAA
jgi:hypothetical protein